MFFSFCNDNSTAAIAAELRLQYNNRLPIITPTLVHEAKSNWSALVLMMALDMRDELKNWFSKRVIVEGSTANVQPSFELLCVALWLRATSYLNLVAANNGGNMPSYLSHRDENDAFGQTVWHFANCGLGELFIADAKQSGYMPPLPRTYICNQEIPLPKNISFPTNDLKILRLHATLYCGDSNAIRSVIQNANPTYHAPSFCKLASIGCWHGLLICIASGWCDPETTNALAALKICDTRTDCLNGKEYWEKISAMPRDTKIPSTTPLLTYLENPTFPDICFAYVVYQFTRPRRLQKVESGAVSLYNNPKPFYGKCLNVLLQNCCKTLQPHVLELLFFAIQSVRPALDAETLAVIKPHVQTFYPTAVSYLYPEIAVTNEAANEQLAQSVAPYALLVV